MSPSDSRSSPDAVMGSRASLTQGPRAKRHSSGSLRFLTILSASAVPSHPGEPGRCRRSLLHGRCQASPYLEGLATLTCVTRPNRVHAFALRLTPLPSEASTAGSLRQPLGRLHGERTTTMVSTFQLTRTVKLRLTHQISQKDADFEIQIGEIGVICGSLSPFLVSFRHWGGFKATCLCGGKSAWDLATHHFEVDGLAHLLCEFGR